MSEQQYGALADRYARQFGVPPRLFRLLIRAESSWNPNAASGAGARGLTQVVPKWHPNADLSTPQGQLEYGAKHLGSLLKKYGNARDALAVYNSGKPWSISKNYGETNAYVTKILGQFGSGAPQSGGAAPADAGAVPPAVPASLPAGQLDAKNLLKLLRGQTQRSLEGLMPTQNFRSTLMDLAEESLPRAQTYVAGKTVGQVAANAGQQVQQATPGYSGPLPNIPARNIPFGADPQGDYDWAERLAKQFGLRLTSGYRDPAAQRATGSRAGMRSRHLVRGGAADISGSPAQMRALAEWAIRSGQFAEVFYDPLGYYWDNGRLNRGGIGGHSDHVHISYGRTPR